MLKYFMNCETLEELKKHLQKLSYEGATICYC